MVLIGSFLNFHSLYQENEELLNGLLCSILNSCVEKLSGNKNIKYDFSELSFCIDLAESGNNRGYGFVAL